MIELDFPSTPPEAVTLTETELDGILKGLTIKKEDIIYTGKTVYDFFIEIDSREFAGLQTINFESLSRLETRGVIITCRGTSAKHDFSSRWFGPRYVNGRHQYFCLNNALISTKFIASYHDGKIMLSFNTYF